MARNVDYYEILGVSRDATPEEIRRAYRRLARQCHPDVCRDDPQAEERFKQLTEAYRVLSDPQLRERYDRTGTVDEVPVGDGVGEPFDEFFDLVEAFFGIGGGRRTGRTRQAARGRDIEAEVTITLRDVLHGAARTIRYERVMPCEDCDGTGSRSRSRPATCPTCRGHGRVRYVQTYFFAEVSTSAQCPECGGRGVVISDPCPRCRGRGVRPSVEEVHVEIPPGVESGQRLVVPGYGDFPPLGRGTPGDLIVRVIVEPHPRFKRNGPHLEGVLELNVAQAALGDTVTIEGVDGPVQVAVPPGSQPGDVVVVRGKGLPIDGRPARRGDLRLHLTVTIPKPRSRRERELLEELRRLWSR